MTPWVASTRPVKTASMMRPSTARKVSARAMASRVARRGEALPAAGMTPLSAALACRLRPDSQRVRGQRDELEAVDVDEPAVGDLQAGDHRESEERQRLEGRRVLAAERARGLDACLARLDDLRQRRVGQEP